LELLLGFFTAELFADFRWQSYTFLAARLAMRFFGTCPSSMK